MEELGARGHDDGHVTHEMGFAREVADRVIFMDQGRILEESDPESFFSAPWMNRPQNFLSQIIH